jgi:hypothetical protein
MTQTFHFLTTRRCLLLVALGFRYMRSSLIEPRQSPHWLLYVSRLLADLSTRFILGADAREDAPSSGDMPMVSAKCLIKSAWIAVEVARDRSERVLVVETYIAVSPLEPNFDAAQYERVLCCVQKVLKAHPEIDRASILSMQRGSGCTALCREPPASVDRPAAA